MAGMCMMCDGASIDEVRFGIHGLIARHGFAITGCEGAAGEAGWSYTIGLVTQFDHPELVVLDTEHTRRARILDGLGELVKAGERLDGDVSVVFRTGEVFDFVDVHPVHFDRGLLNIWLDYMGALGPLRPQPRALQVIQDHGPRCDKHWIPGPPRLDSPRAVFTGSRPNRSKPRPRPGDHLRPGGRPRRGR